MFTSCQSINDKEETIGLGVGGGGGGVTSIKTCARHAVAVVFDHVVSRVLAIVFIVSGVFYFRSHFLGCKPSTFSAPFAYFVFSFFSSAGQRK